MRGDEGPEAVRDDVDGTEEERLPDPEPLLSPGAAANPYPLDALPTKMRNAVIAYQRFGQQPLAMVSGSALSTLSLCAQGLANVARGPHLIGPISLYRVDIAVSGERKTSADRALSREVRDWQHERREAMRPSLVKSQSDLAAWTAEREGLLAKIKQQSGQRPGKNALEIPDLKDRLAALDAAKPSLQFAPRLFFEDATPEAMGRDIGEGWPSASWWSDEAGMLIGSHAMSDASLMRTLALCNRLWDGLPHVVDRASKPGFAIIGRRFTISMMMQPAVFAQLLGLGDGMARGIGFIARCLLSWPDSTMGERPYRDNIDLVPIMQFNGRLRELLDSPMQTVGAAMELDPPTLSLTLDAKREWIKFHDAMERELGRAGEFRQVHDLAAKTAENAARIAGLFHVFECGAEGEIAAEILKAAAAIAAWHVGEARRILVLGTMNIPQAVSDALLIVAWMRKPLADDSRRWEVSPRDVLRDGPVAVRDKGRRDAAAKILLEKNHIFELQRSGATVWSLHPILRGAE